MEDHCPPLAPLGPSDVLVAKHPSAALIHLNRVTLLDALPLVSRGHLVTGSALYLLVPSALLEGLQFN